jgi:diguanylate cyclase (GGDEF)-like protein
LTIRPIGLSQLRLGTKMIEFLCTIAGLIAGATIVASLGAIRQEQTSSLLEKTLDLIDMEMMDGVAQELCSVTKKVSDDMQAHTEKIELVNGLLQAPDDQKDKVVSALNEIVVANRSLREQLAEAQLRMAQLSDAVQETAGQARRDSLTGLANRRALDEYLHDLLNSRKEKDLHGLLILDIDQFKSVNDTHGHSAGDGVLKCFALNLASASGEKAFPARYGGEEFVVILNGDSELELIQKATKIRKFVSEQSITHGDVELVITASAGFSFLGNEDDLKTAYERSDKGLYVAKENGRNKGFWLNEDSWEEFPDSYSRSAQPSDGGLRGVDQSGDGLESSLNGLNEIQPTLPSIVFLDLPVFARKLAEKLHVLHRAQLPAGCIMIEAVGQDLDNDCLQNMLAVVSRKIRGTDLVCIYRQMTICLFLPGSHSTLVIERACELLTVLNRELNDWVSSTVPGHFAVGAGHALENEDPTHFLNRIELALDEAHDASPQEIVVHHGDSTYFQEI